MIYELYLNKDFLKVRSTKEKNKEHDGGDQDD